MGSTRMARRGDVAGDERNAAEQHRHSDEGERVVGADSVNQLGDQARQAEGGGDADAQLLTVRSEGHA